MENSETDKITQPPSIAPKTKTIILLVLLTAASLSVGFILGYIAGTKRSTHITYSQDILSQSNPKVTTTPSLTPHPTTDYSNLIIPTPLPPKTITKIPGWLTYTNSVYKYTIQYPPDWTIDSTQANNLEKFDDSLCCNTASLSISQGNTKWLFDINRQYTGFDAPDECQPGPNQCQYTRKDINVLGYSLYRIITHQNSTGKLVEAYLATPGENNSSHPGFGQVGLTTEYINPTNIKYFINYAGPEIEKYLTTLDRISESLQAIE